MSGGVAGVGDDHRLYADFATAEVSLKSRSKRLWPDNTFDDQPKVPNRLLDDWQRSTPGYRWFQLGEFIPLLDFIPSQNL